MNKGAKLIADEISGLNFKICVINSKQYIIYPPCIARIAGACSSLVGFTEGDSIAAVLRSMKNVKVLAEGLSWFIKGDTSLAKELELGTMDEVVHGLECAFSLIDIRDFMKAVSLSRSVAELTAKPK